MSLQPFTRTEHETGRCRTSLWFDSGERRSASSQQIKKLIIRCLTYQTEEIILRRMFVHDKALVLLVLLFFDVVCEATFPPRLQAV